MNEALKPQVRHENVVNLQHHNEDLILNSFTDPAINIELHPLFKAYVSGLITSPFAVLKGHDKMSQGGV